MVIVSVRSLHVAVRSFHERRVSWVKAADRAAVGNGVYENVEDDGAHTGNEDTLADLGPGFGDIPGESE